MESRRNKKIFNTIMVAVIAVIAIGGVISVGFIKGWFSDEGEQAALAGKVTGVVNIERKGCLLYTSISSAERRSEYRQVPSFGMTACNQVCGQY